MDLHSNYDLLIVDYKLENIGEHGDTFIKNIRSNNIYTDIIFYSSAQISELWNKVHDKKLEGVFLSNRSNLLTKVEKVAEQIVKKVLDLNNVRGIVMAEVGEMDGLLNELATKGFAILDENQKSGILKRYVGKIAKFHKKQKRKVREIDNIDNFLKYCDSARRWYLVKAILTEIDKKALSCLGDYQADVLHPRNFLAHGIPESTENGLKFSRAGGDSYIFNEDESIKLRHALGTYAEKFRSICSKLEQGNPKT